ncbi:hypothetical protein Y032_0003g1157 [Ancylostoma ceylanicum]|uniref:Uncharacterized protein n=1 Tax=Ancylostoma ceylanicum TaxID=53326 RepID=A0A016VXA3_9BILA|nr:hypothetical protein Y032_0003g1157 [Ancylostoma ceylanicum]
MTAVSRAVCHAFSSSRERSFANKIERHGSTRILMAVLWLCPGYKSVNLGNRPLSEDKTFSITVGYGAITTAPGIHKIFGPNRDKTSA